LRPAHGITDAPTAVDYLRHAFIGGLPESVLARSDAARRRWLESYVDHVVQRDVFLVGVKPDSRRLGHYLSALAVHSACVVEAATLFTAAGISRKTALAYDDVLAGLFVVDEVPAWWPSRLSRLTQRPKRYFIDSGLIPAVLGLDFTGITRNAHLVGRMIETFVAAQIRSEIAVAASRPSMFHLREQAGRREVDIILEYPMGKVVAIEVKTAGIVGPSDARHLAWLRDQWRDDFLCGVVLHTGPGTTTISDRIFAAPISTLWA
jgi:predicted AAA+ superfamily ATPase